MNNLVKNFDGSGRVPRNTQVDALNYLDETWTSNKIVGLNASTGSGKSGIGRAIQKEYGGIYLVPTNSLMDQILDDYSSVNYLKGAANYSCHDQAGMTCEDMSIVGKRCSNCTYNKCKTKALNMSPSFMNPMSFLYLKHSIDYRPHNTLIVDECHLLKDYIMMVSGSSFSTVKHGEPKSLTVEDTIIWLQTVTENFKRARKLEDDLERKAQLHRRIESIGNVLTGLYENPNMYVIYSIENYIHVKPIIPPKFMVDQFLDSPKVVLMSATLSRFMIRELLQHDNFAFKELKSPIPVINRQIHYEPNTVPVNYKTDIKFIVSWIKGKMNKHKGKNTIVHLSYGDIKKVKEYFPDAIYNDSSNKTEKINEFKQKGGLFLAGGCAAGVDLPYDECRLNLIPRLIKPNLMDQTVKKRKSLADGEEWYVNEIMNTVIQQAGRSTRAEDDFSTTIIGDTNFKWLYNKVEDSLSSNFKDAILWRSK